jgi:ribosomal-protein-alanine N-acetyltransferase
MRLETERLIVRDYKETDLHEMHRLWSDKEAMYYLDDIWCETIDDTAKYLKIGMENADGHYFCICEKSTGNYMGSIGYTITDTTPLGKIVHMGYMLLPEYHGYGYMTDAVMMVIEFAFAKDNCVRITTGCYKDNEASRKVMEKAGFRKEGERLNAQYHDGEMKDRLEYAINHDEWYVKKDIAYYKSLPVIFDGFIEIPELTDGVIHLVCTHKRHAIPEKKYVPAYDFAICKGSEKVGEVNLRIGYGGFGPDESSLYYGGQIGYGIDEKYRGNGYAVHACRLLLPVAKAHGMIKLLITNNVTNAASKRVCEKLDARLVRTVRLPEWTDLYKEGSRFNNIYEWSVE